MSGASGTVRHRQQPIFALEREGFEIGFASELINSAKNDNDSVNVVRRMFGSKEARDKMVMAFGPNRVSRTEWNRACASLIIETVTRLSA